MSQIKKFLFVTFLLSCILFITKVYSLNPDDVPLATRQTWCADQGTTCVNICLDTDGFEPQTNYCYAETLQYDCICQNGSRPNSTEYTQTVPYFTCTADQQACIRKCQPGAQQCVNECNKVPCAATAVKTPGYIPTSIPAGGGTPSSPSSPGGTSNPTMDPNTLLSNASKSPIESGFMLLLTFVVLSFVRLSSI